MRLWPKDIVRLAGAAPSRIVARFRRGFTLLELLVAVGALAFVAVGIAAIFEATGRTIRAGRRVSDFSACANLIQQRMRADFASMTREGFLIIRNQYASSQGNFAVVLPASGSNSSPDAVPLYADDLHPRLRRIDEIMFFAKGRFQSLRDILHQGIVAQSDAAAIYYGHGERRLQDLTSSPSTYLQPEVDDTNAGGPGATGQNARLGYAQAGNPNQYASDWVLTRRVTLLRPPTAGTNGWRGPSDSFFGTTINPQNVLAKYRDSDIQVALQPAASSIFRSLQAALPAAMINVVRTENNAQHPQIASGLVDIATITLSQIRMIVTTADVVPGAATQNFVRPDLNQQLPGQLDGNHAGADGVFRYYDTTGTTAPADPGSIQRQHDWMSDALPAWSDAKPAANQTRVHCEPAPTNFVGVAANPSGWSDLEQAYRATDQMMLSASNFLPHCTEFIVEWSFGDTFAGQPIWHGLLRNANGQTVAGPYGGGYTIQVPLVQANQYARHDISPVLIHNAPAMGEPLYSFFGYMDPTYNPDAPGGGVGNGRLGDNFDGRDITLPWPWPRLIRITLSLADPNDPSVEQSFQFVFDVPQGTP